jgi:hypothetical protein
VTGKYVDAQGAGHGFIRAPDGGVTEFAISTAAGSGEPPIEPQTIPLGIDANGNVAGLYEDINQLQHAFVRSASGVIQEFEAPGAEAKACPKAMAGNPSYVWFCGTSAAGINATKGITGGFVDSDDVMRGYVRSVSGDYTAFDAPDAGASGISGYVGTAGFGINSAGTIAGSYIDKSLLIHGFVYTPNTQAATTTTLTASRASSVYREPVTLTAKVAAGSEPAPNGGSVTFAAGGKAIGTEKIVSGKAELTTTGLAVGAESITAVYAGVSGFAGSTSKAVDVAVGKAESTVSLKASPDLVVSGKEVTLTAIVAGQFGGTATGSVTFYSGTEVLKTVTLGAAKATYSTSTLSVGAHAIKAVYAGDGNFKGSTSSVVTVTVEN